MKKLIAKIALTTIAIAVAVKSVGKTQRYYVEYDGEGNFDHNLPKPRRECSDN